MNEIIKFLILNITYLVPLHMSYNTTILHEFALFLMRIVFFFIIFIPSIIATIVFDKIVKIKKKILLIMPIAFGMGYILLIAFMTFSTMIISPHNNHIPKFINDYPNQTISAVMGPFFWMAITYILYLLIIYSSIGIVVQQWKKDEKSGIISTFILIICFIAYTIILEFVPTIDSISILHILVFTWMSLLLSVLISIIYAIIKVIKPREIGNLSKYITL